MHQNMHQKLSLRIILKRDGLFVNLKRGIVCALSNVAEEDACVLSTKTCAFLLYERISHRLCFDLKITKK